MTSRHGSTRLALLLVLMTGLAASRPAATEPIQTRIEVKAALQQMPLYFEVNQGQTDRRVQFLARGHGYNLFITSREAVLVLQKAEKSSLTQRRKDAKKNKDRLPGVLTPLREGEQAVRSAVLRMKMLGASPHPKASGQEKLPGQVNYFIGNNPKKWRANVPTYQKVHYKGVYPGIDLVYYGNQQQLEYDFVVQPGANPRKILLAFEGGKQARIDKRGELVLQTSAGEVRWHRPVVYQEVNGKRRPIVANYTLLTPEHRIGFQVAKYDRTKPLVIDPVLAYSTYLGGDGDDHAYGMAVDRSGYIYVTGSTSSTNFPTRNAYRNRNQDYYNFFVTKLDPTQSGAASLLSSTYLGGNAASYLGACDIAVDAAGYVYVTGITSNTDFPTRNAFQDHHQGGEHDAFVTKLDLRQSGAAQLLYSTYLGGRGWEQGSGIAVDGTGKVYVAGTTSSGNFPLKNAYRATYKQIFVTKLDTMQSGVASLLYSTYLGGNSDDYLYKVGITLDATGYVYVAGKTRDTNFPIRNAFQAHIQSDGDAFVSKLDTTKSGDASLLYSTYLGGSEWDACYGGIAVDAAGYVYVTGITYSTDFPIRNAYQGTQGDTDAFVSKLDTTKSGDASLLYSTYLGGRDRDNGTGVAVDAAGKVYVTGFTLSFDFPNKNGYQPGRSGGWSTFDTFVTMLDPTQTGTAQLLYSTYLGGNDNDIGGGIAMDGAGNVYAMGNTWSGDFPTRNAYQDSHQGGGWDAFVVKFSPDPPEATVSGSILLGQCYNLAQLLTFTFRPINGTPSFSRSLTLNGDGAFTLTGIPRQNYQVAIKGVKWLQKVVPLDTSYGEVAILTAELLQQGDANNNNIIDIEDLAALIQTFDAAPSSPNWNGGIADFDCNDIVDVEDLSLLIYYFDESGDP